jgi:hypothetical protein
MDEWTIATQDLGTEEKLNLFHDAGGLLYVGDERIWSISALGDGIVALTTSIRTIHISAADYWRLLHGDAGPSLQEAGILAARLAHLERYATALITALVHEAHISPATYPSIWRQIEALQTFLGRLDTADNAREWASG